MAVHSEQVVESSGYAKEIDDGAYGMIFDNLQRTAYRYPVKSTVRELISNAIDSIREKNMAQRILMGIDKIEDHYEIPKGGVSGLNKDSWWSPEYYDLASLDMDNNKATIIYEEGGNSQRDLLRIIDKGVGLGDKRLQGYMKLGYSSKRLGKHQLGKFGIGAKVGLSTGVKYYTTISVYQGRKYKFNIYSETVDSIVPAMNMEKGTPNKFEIWQRKKQDGTFEDYPVYYESTDEKNGVEVQVQFKKHYKQDLITAVQSQLLYFENVDFKIVDVDGNVKDYPVQAKVLYEDDEILISDNTQYSKPHIIINKVAYGYVDFLELELDNKKGNIGIKVAPHEVDITPSRESVIWEDTTRATIVKRFNQVVDTATKLVEKRLQETDFVKWIRTCISTLVDITHQQTDDVDLQVIRELSNIVDTTKMKPTYSADKSVRYSPRTGLMLKGLHIRLVTSSKFFRGEKEYVKIKREDVKTTSDFGSRPILIQKGNSSNRKDLYLLSKYPNGFITIKDKTEIEGEADDSLLWHQLALGELEDSDAVIDDGTDTTDWIAQNKDNYLANITKLLKLFRESAGTVEYKDVVVPDDFDGKEEEEIVEDAEVKPQWSTDAERRKAQGKIVAFTPGFRGGPGQTMPFTWTKVEPELAVVDNLTDAELYYSTGAMNDAGDKEEEAMMFLATAITRPVETYRENAIEWNEWLDAPPDGYFPPDIIQKASKSSSIPDQVYIRDPYANRAAIHWYGQPTVRFVRVAKQNVKYFQETHNHIRSFFFQLNNGTITMSNALVKWNTARYIREDMDKLAFLKNYGIFNPAMTRAYQELVAYVKKYYRSLDEYSNSRGMEKSEVKILKDHADKVLDLQLFVRANPDNVAGIAEAAKQLFATEDGVITNGIATELEVLDKLHALLDYAKPVGMLLNQLSILTKEEGVEISAELETELKFYIIQKRGEL